MLMSEMSRPSRGVYTFWLLARSLLWMVKSSTSRFPFSVNLGWEAGVGSESKVTGVGGGHRDSTFYNEVSYTNFLLIKATRESQRILANQRNVI